MVDSGPFGVILKNNPRHLAGITYITYIRLAFEGDAYAADFATQGWGKFGHTTLNLYDLRELLLHGADDILRHALDGAALDAHNIADNLIDRKVVHSLLHSVLVGHCAQLGSDCKLHIEAVAHNLLQVVAAVVGAELHLLKANSVKHSVAELLYDNQIVVLLTALRNHILASDKVLLRYGEHRICNLLLVQ